MNENIEFNEVLISRYDTSGPRYTSYPTVPQFLDVFDHEKYREIAERSNEAPVPPPLSLYFHLPFCATVCYYCACNKIITKNRSRAVPYLESLHNEVVLQGNIFEKDRIVEQLHWGGGTPTFINIDQIAALMDITRKHFSLRDDDTGEYSIEIDPRESSSETIRLLRTLGFNRISIGVQDFEPEVQKAVNRIQSEEVTRAAVETARTEGFKSVSMDLIYGLPRQSVETFANTLEKILIIGPDRLSVFNYAHLPERFKTQRQISESDLPAPAEKLRILKLVIDVLTDAGYVYIGMDHFAKYDDELAVAQRNGTLCRNFQGYSTHSECDIIGMGVSAISKIGSSYTQNTTLVDEYEKSLSAGKIPVTRGITLDYDDKLRGYVINQLICYFQLDIIELAEQQGINFEDYFSNEIQLLKRMEKDGLITINTQFLKVEPAGRLLIRNICMIFDKYIRHNQNGRQYSRLI